MEYDVFLAHNSIDKSLVVELASLLRKEGLRVFLDKDYLNPGERWLDGIERALHSSRACAACIGPSGVGQWTREEIAIAIDLDVRGLLVMIPVLLPGASSPEEYDLPASIRQRHWSDLRWGFDDKEVQRLVSSIQRAGSQLARGQMQVLRDENDHRARSITYLGGGAGELMPDQLVEKAHTQEAEIELVRLRREVSDSPMEAREKANRLVERLQNGDLRYAKVAAKTQALQLAARRSAADPESGYVARRYRDLLKAVDQSADTVLIDALLLKSEGDVDSALRLIRDIDTADAHDIMFTLLNGAHGDAFSLAWYRSQERGLDPDFFTARGWCNLAVALAQVESWEEATEVLAGAAKHRENYDDFSYIEGVMNAALLIPAEYRHLALRTNLFPARSLEGADADRRRSRAIQCFLHAEQALKGSLPERASAAKEWSLWLRLTHSSPDEREKGRAELTRAFESPDISEAISLIPLADTFGVLEDIERYWEYLSLRKKVGGLSRRELHSIYVLAKRKLDAEGFLAFLSSEEERLVEILSESVIVFEKLRALLTSGQVERARATLEQARNLLEVDDYRRADILIKAQEGGDLRADLEAIYRDTNSLDDLDVLTSYLESSFDWSALRPLLAELFERDRSLRNLRRLVVCMEHDPSAPAQELLDLFVTNADLVDRDFDLIGAKAHALFYLGRVEEARSTNDWLLTKRDHGPDLDLDINLALQLGDWERLPGIVEREWGRRERRNAGELIRLASLAAETDATASRAFEFVKLAAEKGNEDPEVLMTAVSLTYKLGREEELPPEWLMRALSLSSDNGPVKRVATRHIVEELMPKQEEQRRVVEDLWLRGEIPAHLLASRLNIPLSMLLIDRPYRNARLHDPRARGVVPIMSGARSPLRLETSWSIGLDITSIMVLAYLGCLEQALGSFRKVLLAPETMVLLLNERNQIRFHQPSLVKRALEIRQLLDLGNICVAENLPEPPSHLLEEVGKDLAQLLEAARRDDSCVVKPRPIYRLRSLGSEEATLQGYEGLVVSTVELERWLYDSGWLDHAAHERARKYLSGHDQGSELCAGATAFRSPVYLDGLAFLYLYSAGLLTALVGSGIEFRVHPSFRKEQVALVENSHERERLERVLEEIRVTLRDAFQAGKLEFLRRASSSEEEERDLLESAPTIAEFMHDLGECDAVAIDDRFMQSLRAIVDRRGGEKPVIGTLDIIRHLELQELITREQRSHILHRLRQADFLFVPLELDVLLGYLRAASLRIDGSVIESAELRVVRQSIARVRSLGLLDRAESSFVRLLELVSVMAVRQLWADDLVQEERAFALSSWVFDHVFPVPWNWFDFGDNELPGVVRAFADSLSALFMPVPIDGERLDAFICWLQEKVLWGLLPANAEVVDLVANTVGEKIRQWSIDGEEESESGILG